MWLVRIRLKHKAGLLHRQDCVFLHHLQVDTEAQLSTSRFQWPCGLRYGSAGSGLLESRVRITLKAWLSICCKSFVRRADHSSRGFLPSVVYLSVMSKPQQWGRLGPLGLSKYGGVGWGNVFSQRSSRCLQMTSYRRIVQEIIFIFRVYFKLYF
jgi:hypothetical protein